MGQPGMGCKLRGASLFTCAAFPFKLRSEMSLNLPWQRPWFRAAGLFGLWTLVGLAFAGQFYISGSKAGASIRLGQAILWSLGDWYAFALLSVPVLWLARRFPVEAPNRVRHLLLHLLASAVFCLSYLFLRAAVGQLPEGGAGEEGNFGGAVQLLARKTWFFNVLVYWLILGMSTGLRYYRDAQERQRRAVELEQRLTAARLQALQMQLNPHFLFNSLNAVSSLMHVDVDAADRTLSRLADLLRRALASSSEQEVSLRQEIDFLRCYLEIEQTRFGDRLTVDVAIPDELAEARVPTLILQPLVENAIRHGIEPMAAPGAIRISAERLGDELILRVTDTGRGPGSSNRHGTGIGVANTRARLEQLYGSAQEFRLAPGANGGTEAVIRLPLKKSRTSTHAL